MRTDYYVYILFRETGIPLYVGKGVDDRWNHDERAKRKSNGTHLHLTINSIHHKGCEVPKIKIAEGLTNHEAQKIEIAFIAAIGRETEGGPLINQTCGGDGCVDPSPEITLKRIMKIKGRKNPGTQKSMLLQWQPDHLVYNKRLAQLAIARAAAHSANTGKKRSEETRLLMRNAKLGKPLSDEHKTVLSKVRQGRRQYVMTDEIRAKMKEAKKGARWFTDGQQSRLIHRGTMPPNGWYPGRTF